MMGQASPEMGTPRALASRNNCTLPAALICWQWTGAPVSLREHDVARHDQFFARGGPAAQASGGASNSLLCTTPSVTRE